MSSLGLAAMGPEHAGPGLVRGEVDALLGDALATARRLLDDHRALLDMVVAELLDEETLDLEGLLALRGEVEAAPVA